jgi:hypothetical protein
MAIWNSFLTNPYCAINRISIIKTHFLKSKSSVFPYLRKGFCRKVAFISRFFYPSHIFSICVTLVVIAIAININSNHVLT